jgi:hypothetical protein
MSNPTTESRAMTSFAWGDPMLAQLAGSDAQAHGTDALGTVVRAMRSEPEPLDAGAMGNASTSLFSGFRWPWLPDANERPEGFQGASEAVGAALGVPVGGVGALGSETLQRGAWGLLGVALVVVGAAALTLGGKT